MTDEKLEEQKDFEQIRKSLFLAKLIAEAFNTRQFSVAKTYIEGSFLFADKVRDSWNYDNILHNGHTYLGLIALEEGDVEEAKKNLLLSAAIKGSPQIRSFGPDMILAKKLLELGEKQIVLRYLNLCGNFWTWFLSYNRLRKWKKAIKAGEIPNFGYNERLNIDLHQSPKMESIYHY